MRQLICEMCGGKDLIKQDGVFVCQSCGTKYSVEEAKKLMLEGTVDITGTVIIDESTKIDNYFTMAENAYKAGNEQEAESYCNKIIEIDPKNHNAWFLKGKAAGWQSNLKNIRIGEAVNCFNKAIDNAPEETIEHIKKEAADEISSLSKSLMKLCCDNFARYPSNDNKTDILNNLQMVKSYSLLLLNKCGVKPKEFYKDVAIMMNTSVCDAWDNVITKDYKHSDHPTQFTWQTFKERCKACIEIINEAINLSDDDKTADVYRYKNLIDITTALVKSCSYTYSINCSDYVIEWSLSDEAKQKYNNNIITYHQKIKEIDPSYEIPFVQPQKANESTQKNLSTSIVQIVVCIIWAIFMVYMLSLMRPLDWSFFPIWIFLLITILPFVILILIIKSMFNKRR